MFNKFNNFKILILSTLFFSMILSVSSSSWMVMWLSMEINMISFIPLMMKPNHMKTSESMMLYFVIQSISSMNFLFFIILKNLNMNWMNLKMFNFMWLINMILLMKLGAAPFYFWFPKIVMELNWNTNFILMTWQKFIPMILINYCLSYSLIMMSIILSSVIGSFKGLNQSNLKLLMAFSSINHVGWLMSALLMNFYIWIFYYLNYILLNYLICKNFFLMNLKFLNNLFMSNFNKYSKLILYFNFFSLSGLPPFLGFFPKWMVIMKLMENNNFLIMFILINTALINIFFYLRLLIPSLIFSYTQLKHMNINKNNFNYNYKYYILTYLSLYLLIIITLIYY